MTGLAQRRLSFIRLAFMGCNSTLVIVALCVVSTLNAGKYTGHLPTHMTRILARVEGRDNTECHEGQGPVAPHKGQPDEGQAWSHDAHGDKDPPDIDDPPVALVDEEVCGVAHWERHQVHADVWQGGEDTILW